MTRREVLSNASNRVVLWPGMYSALVNGELLLLDDKAEIRGGKLCVPSSFAKLLEARLARPEGAVVEARQRVRIVIDPGHGGRDSGAVSRRGWAEKDINLDISKRLAAGLEAKGFDVIMTRRSDVFLSLEERVGVSNRNNADIFISVHTNSVAADASASGIETFYVDGEYDPVERGMAAAAAPNVLPELEEGEAMAFDARLERILCGALFEDYVIQSRDLAQAIQAALARALPGERNRGIKNSRRLAVLRGTRCARVLVEVGFISNPQSRADLNNAQYRQSIAEGLAAGVLQFVQRMEKWQ
ncbi:MAG: hypothetical protein FJ278_15375 [Planctomycetes bacterium]|nr:hypothetical protein [Planctomycetota bacterium]